jgi:hypothetical protein
MQQESGLAEDAMASLLAASRGAEPRAAEQARGLLPGRYPYVYEFRRAIDVDPGNKELRRELGFLLLEMGDKAAGERELDGLVDSSAGPAPALLNRSEAPAGPESDPREMGFKSFHAGYLNDAVRFFSAALENDPLDFPVMLQLGWTHNLLEQDREAVSWFDLASKSQDSAVAGEARRARRNLVPNLRRVRMTVWALPMFSTRWHSGFAYGQVKVDFRIGNLPFRPYLSARFIGDTRSGARAGSFGLPQYLSETAAIPGAGVMTSSWHGLLAWAEAGFTLSYLPRAGQSGTLPDYRGGVSFSRAWGSLIGAEAAGFFLEHHLDGVYVHRFGRTFLVNTQNRAGVTVPAGPLHAQFTWSWNANADAKRQYWANFVETGPGVRFRIDGMPPSMTITADALHGRNTVNEGNPRARLYNDLRVGIWYAFTY